MKESTKNTMNRRVYKILNYYLKSDDYCCYLCPFHNRQSKKAKWKKCHGCKPNKGEIRNWKEFRNKQYKK